MKSQGEYITASPEVLCAAITRALTGSPSLTAAEEKLHAFIQRWPHYTGGWLLYQCGRLNTEVQRQQQPIPPVFISLDRHNSWMTLIVCGMAAPEDYYLNDALIRREQFIYFQYISDVDSQDFLMRALT